MSEIRSDTSELNDPKVKKGVISHKAFNTLFLVILLGGLVTIAIMMCVIDPLFHYHAPLKGMSYSLNDERYQNNGIVKHFTYDAMITGTSMTENFKASEADELFGVNSIKTCFMGGSYREISENIRTALEYNPDLKLIIRATDQFDLITPSDKHPSTDPETTFEYPLFLLDNNVFNDLEYVLNKSLLSDAVTDVKMTLTHTPSTTFDEYMNWMSMYEFGKESVLKTYSRPPKSETEIPLTDEEREKIRDNIQKNIIDLANDYPDVTFYTWIPPYSVCYYDVEQRKGTLKRDMDAMEYELELLVDVPNIRLYGYDDREDIVTDLSLYKDMAHYGESVNSEVLRAMSSDEGRITANNYKDYMDRVRTFYLNYDYESIYQ